MFLNISRADNEGQFIEPLVLEVKTFYIHGFTDGGMIFDVTHADGEKERLVLKGGEKPWSPMSIGKLENVNSLTIIEWGPAVTKDQFREIVGKGKTLTPGGYYAQQD